VQLQIAPLDLGADGARHRGHDGPAGHGKGPGTAAGAVLAGGALLRGDEIRLRQVLVNLLGNAIKFTAKGAVTLRLDAPPDPGGPRLLIEVEDSGPGIAPEDQARVFDPFVQVGQTSGPERHRAGAGDHPAVRGADGRADRRDQPARARQLFLDRPAGRAGAPPPRWPAAGRRRRGAGSGAGPARLANPDRRRPARKLPVAEPVAGRRRVPGMQTAPKTASGGSNGFGSGSRTSSGWTGGCR
jgi:hypothetical protein